jgi:hypothetical protein
LTARTLDADHCVMRRIVKRLSAGFHAFTFEGNVFSGAVTEFEDVEGVVQFTYSYVEDGVSVVGSFTGEQRPDGAVVGAWKEQSNLPLAGRTNWQGAAMLHVTELDGRRVLSGAWTMPRISERWMLEVPA